ncbi:MAG: hypothetical protein WD734_06190 [Dehalococcoidia bacterium]
MDDSHGLPAAMDEAAFLRAYEASAIRKPQIVADNVLTGIFLADATYRAALTALLVQEAVEAARRLNLVWLALTDRSRPVAQRLAGPLPTAEDWTRFAEAVERAAERPESLLAEMAIDDSVLQSAEDLVGFEGLARFAVPLRVFDAGTPTVVTLPGTPPTLMLSNVTDGRYVLETRIPLVDEQVIALGDAAGDFVTWSRDFLGAFIDAREAATER